MRITILSVIPFLLIASAAAGIDLDSLLVKSVGGPDAFNRLRQATSIYAEGFVRMNTMEGRFRQAYRAPDKFYLEIDFEGYRIVQAFDGTTAWQTDQNGQATVLDGLERQELLSNLYFESYSYILDQRLSGSMEYAGNPTIDGIDYHQVTFYPLGSDTVEILFESETGLKRITYTQYDDMKTTILTEQFDTIDGVVFPSHTSSTTEGVPLETEFWADLIEINRVFAPDLFLMPSENQIDYHFPPDRTAVIIPFEYKLGHIRLEATINGKKDAWFILDSGASANIFNKSFIADQQLPIVGSIPARGLSGYSEAQLVRVDSVNIGELTLFDQVGGAIDLSLLDAARTNRFGGLLGFDFLSRFPILIDYQNQTLTVFNPNSFVPPDSGVVVPFFLTMQTPTIKAELDGIAGDFIVDLGNAFGLIIHPEFIEANGLEDILTNISNDFGSLGGVGGQLPSRIANAETFKMGDVLIDSLKVIMADKAFGMSRSKALAGNVGNRILQNFKLLFDYDRSRLIFYQVDK